LAFREIAALALALLSLESRAHASTDMVRLDVRRGPGAESCADAEIISSLVERKLGRRALDPSAPDSPATIAVELSKDAARYAARIVAPSGERSIEGSGASCEPLARAVALSLTLMLEQSESKPQKATRKPARPTASIEAPGAQEDSAGLDVMLETGAGAAFFLVGRASALERVGVSLQMDRLQLGLSTLLILPGNRFPLGPGSIALQLLGGTLSVGYALLEVDALSLSLGLSASAGALRAQAIGFTQNQNATRPWLAGGTFLLLRIKLLGPLDAYGRADLMVPRSLEAFTVRNAGTAFTPDRVNLLTSLGLSVTFD
jgi:hypothetical protein